MSRTTAVPTDRLVHASEVWLAAVADELETADGEFVYRATRAWLHVVRDRLAVVDAAHFGSQLPELLRGIFYEGWSPAHVPVKYSQDEFVQRFAHEAIIGDADVAKVARCVSAAIDRKLNGRLPTVLERFPEAIRETLMPWHAG